MYLPISPALCTLLPLALCPHNLPATLFLPTSQSSHPHLLHHLPPACWRDWDFYAFFVSLFFLISDYAMSFGEKFPYTWERYGFSSTWELSWTSQSHLCLLLATPTLCPIALSKRKLYVWAWRTEWDTHHLVTPYGCNGLWATSSSPPTCHYTASIMLLIKSFVVIHLTLNSTTTPAELKENVI